MLYDALSLIIVIINSSNEKIPGHGDTSHIPKGCESSNLLNYIIIIDMQVYRPCALAFGTL